MIEIQRKEDCCGCSACASVCPKHCIQMKEDEEGFLYPLVDEKECIKCSLCNKTCPIKTQIPDEPKKQSAYLLQHRNEKIRAESTSGGAFTAIAKYVLERNGVVFGAAYDEAFNVKHIYVESYDELKKLRKSKYVQSEIGSAFIQVKDFLRHNRWVCFSGTPCQIEGLVKYIGKKPDNLLLVDIMCHAVPSPLAWRKYLEYQANYISENSSILFRDKSTYGYQYAAMTIISDNKKVYSSGVESDPMLRAFFSDICDRPSCYHCHFKKRYRCSDITIWDCFSVYKFDKQLDDDKGTTRLLAHSDLGRAVISELSTDAIVNEFPVNDVISGVNEMLCSVKENPQRDSFFKDAMSMTGAALFNKYFPISFKIKVKREVREILWKTHMYTTVKRLIHLIKE